MEERELVAGIAARLEECAELFLDRYRAPLLHCIGRFERDASLQEDLFQELASHLIEQLAQGRFDPEKGSLGSWLYRVAWCRCVDHRRRQRVPEVSPDAEPVEAEDPEPDPSVTVARTEIGNLVRRALEELPPEDGALLRLRHFEGLGQAELAERLGMPLDKAKYRLKRATERLRARLLALEDTTEVLG